MIIIYILLTILPSSKGGYSMTQTQFGCKVPTQSPCTEMCQVGVEDCSQTIPVCEYGYFLFTLQKQAECVRCPYQDSTDSLVLLCMDCVENPYTWELSRQCTYDYTVKSGDPTSGTYIKVPRPYTELFLVGTSLGPGINTGTITRSLDIPYDVYICSGCSNFCNPQTYTGNGACNPFVNSYSAIDSDKIGLTCLGGYYFSGNLCQSCPQDRCLTCNANGCQSCEQAYTPSVDQKTCVKCPTNCLSCTYFDGALICNTCDRSNPEFYYVESLNRQSCILCGDGCYRCEYVSYSTLIVQKVPTRAAQIITSDTDFYVLKCRQCQQSGFSLHYSGTYCEPCQIRNCDVCYYEIRTGVTTLDLDFEPRKPSESIPIQLCFKCQSGYFRSADKWQCNSVASIPALSVIPNCLVYNLVGSVYKCVLCAQTYIFDSDNNGCFGTCSSYIKNCKYCYAYSSLDLEVNVDSSGTTTYQKAQQLFQCQECNSGYYPDFFTGECIACSSNCDQCWQYTQSYNYTEYLGQQKIIDDNTKASYLDLIQEATFCSMCSTGYNSYSNQCLGCQSDCVIANPGAVASSMGTALLNMCTYQSTDAFCGQCYNSYSDRSLTANKGKCHSCPENCVACRERTTTEKNKVNPYFYPTNEKLLQYGRLCYLVQTKLPTLQTASYNSYINMPITCKYTSLVGQTKKCRKTAKASVSLYCDITEYQTAYSAATPTEQAYIFYLGKFFNVKTDRIAYVTFSSLESFSTYKQLNDEVVEQLELTINLIQEGLSLDPLDYVSKRICSFTKTTQIISRFQQNVFSMSNFKLIFKSQTSDNSKILLNLGGLLQFPYLSDVKIQGFEVRYSAGLGYSDVFGIQVLDNVLSQFTLQNMNIGRHLTQKNQFKLLLSNVESLNLIDVTFYDLQTDHQIDQTYTVVNMTKQSTYIDGLTFTNMQFKSMILFQLNEVKTSTITFNVGTKGLTFDRCIFNQSNIIGEDTSNQLSTGTMVIQKLVFKFCNFVSSYFINLRSQNATKITNLDIIKCEFTNTQFLYLNSFEIEFVYVFKSTFLSPSRLVTTVEKVIDIESSSNATKLYKFSNVHVRDCVCPANNCILYIKTPENTFDIVSNVTLKNIQIYNTDTTGIAVNLLFSVNSALVLITQVGKVEVNGLLSDSNFGITILSVITCHSLKLSNGLYDWSTQQYGPQPKDPFDETSKSGNTILYPKNNKIPMSIACANKKIDYGSFSQLFIYVSQFLYGVSIEDVTIRRQLAIDTSFIQVDSWRIELYNTTIQTPTKNQEFYNGSQYELINFTNVRIIGNSLTVTQSLQGIAPIYIKSAQAQNIIIKGCSFIDNHLHILVNDTISISTPTLSIDSTSSNSTIMDTIFKQNRGTKSKYPVLVLKTNYIVLLRTTFSESNILTQSWYDRLEESTLLNSNDTITMRNIKTYFQIQSYGGNGLFQAQNANITDCQFSDGHAIIGAGLLIILIEEGKLTIMNTKFQNQINNLNPEYLSAGGCLYIDSSGSKLNFTMSNVSMLNCVARLSGGCIFIEPSTLESTIKMTNSTFLKCQGLDSSFMSAEFSKSSTIEPDVQMTNVNIMDNDLEILLHNIPSISDSELSLFRSTGTAYKQVYGKLTLSKVTFGQLKCISALYITSMISVLLNDLSVSYNLILWNPLVYIDLQTTYGQLIMSESQFMENIELKVQTNLTNYTACSRYIQTYSTYSVAAQTCVAQAAAQILFKKIEALAKDLASIVLYNATMNTQYISLVDGYKYSFPTIYFDQAVYQDIPYPYNTGASYPQQLKLTNDELNSFRSCYISYIYAYSESIATTTTVNTAVIYIQAIHFNNTFKLSSIDFENNQCLRCAGGLFQVTNIQNYGAKNIELLDINCHSNIIGYYGCISVTSQSKFEEATLQLPITDYPVLNTSARLLTLKDEVIAQNHTITIQNSQFIQNKAKVGGGISVLGINVLIINCEFSDNYASLMGGAIFFKSSVTEQTLLLYDNNFQNNVAQIAGGVFVSGSAMGRTDLMQIDFNSNNGTVRGNNIEEKPSSLSIFMQKDKYMNTKPYMNHTGDSGNDGYVDNTTASIIDIIDLPLYQLPNHDGFTNYLLLPSGQTVKQYLYYYEYTQEQVPYEWMFRIINLDRFNQPMSNIDKTSKCKVSGRMMDSNKYDDTKEFLSNFTTASSYQYDASLGAFDLDLLTVIFDPYMASNLFLQLKFICDSISIPVYRNTTPYDIIGYNTNYALLVNIQTFKCQLGEAYNSQMCKSCEAGDNTYSVTLNQHQCSSIDNTQMDQVAPTAIKLKAGYWRVDFDYETIVSCSNQEANCNGGWKPGDSSCYSGHMGGQCESCDLYATRSEDSYSTSAKYTCGLCGDTVAVNSLVITAISIFTLVSIVLSVKGNYQMLEDYVRNLRLITMGILISNEQSNLAILIKLFTNYFQIISSLATFQLSFPSSLSSTVQVVGNPTQSMAYSLDCFLYTMTNIDILYFRMIWALVMPIAYLATFFLGYFFGVLIKKIPYKVGIIYTTFIYMFIYLQPTLVGGFIALASTRTLGGAQFVQADVAYRSDSTAHQFWLGAFVTPLLLAWAVIFPGIFFLFVYQIRHNLNDVENRRKLGFFYNEYTSEGYFWEFVKIFQKELIIICLTYYEDRIVVKGLIIFVIVFFYGGFTVAYDPYSSKRLNFIDRLSTAICGVSLCLGVLIYAATLEDLTYLTILMFIVVGIINITFILLMVYYLFEGYLIKFQEHLDKIRDKIRIYYPELPEKYPWLRKLLINKTKMAQRVKGLWGLLRYEIRSGIKRKRKDPNAPLLMFNEHAFPVLRPFEGRSEPALSQNTYGHNSAMNRSPKVYPQNNTIQDSPMHEDGGRQL